MYVHHEKIGHWTIQMAISCDDDAMQHIPGAKNHPIDPLTDFSQISFLPMAEGNLWEISGLAGVFEFLVDDSSNWASLLMT